MSGELSGQCCMGAVGFGGHQQAAGLLVQPVHDAGPAHPANAGKTVAAMRQQGMHQCTLPVTGGGMHDQPGRLVDDDQLAIFISHIKRDGFGLRCGIDQRQVWSDKTVAGFDPVGGVVYRRARYVEPGPPPAAPVTGSG